MGTRLCSGVKTAMIKDASSKRSVPGRCTVLKLAVDCSH